VAAHPLGKQCVSYLATQLARLLIAAGSVLAVPWCVMLTQEAPVGVQAAGAFRYRGGREESTGGSSDGALIHSGWDSNSGWPDVSVHGKPPSSTHAVKPRILALGGGLGVLVILTLAGCVSCACVVSPRAWLADITNVARFQVPAGSPPPRDGTA
jgi:hypothetical protein